MENKNLIRKNKNNTKNDTKRTQKLKFITMLSKVGIHKIDIFTLFFVNSVKAQKGVFRNVLKNSQNWNQCERLRPTKQVSFFTLLL